MNAFARAAAALYRDRNLSVACEWYPAWARDWPRSMEMDLEAESVTLTTAPLSLRGIISQPIAQTFGVGQPGAVAGQISIELLITDAPLLKKGDLIAIDGVSRKIEQRERDPEGLTWRLTLSTST